MDVVTHEREGIDGTRTGLHDLTKSIQELLPVEIINEKIALIATPQHDVVEGSRCIQAGVAWHRAILLWAGGVSI